MTTPEVPDIGGTIDDAIKDMQKQVIEFAKIAAIGLAGLIVGAFIIKWVWTKVFPSEAQLAIELTRKWATPQAVGQLAGAAAGNPAALVPH